MSNLLFFIGIISGCPTPKVVDWTKTRWIGQDNEAYSRSIQGCQDKFKEDAPCLTKFIKKDVGTYYAICGDRISKVRTAPSSREYWFLISPSKLPRPKG